MSEKLNKQVVIHLGLPKSATTSLQQYIFNTIQGKWTYLGVAQPRNEQQNDLYKSLMKYVGMPEKSDELLSSCKESLAAMASSGGVFISEEMFSVDTKVTWQSKISRLYEIFADWDTQILITVRNPVRAAFSLYVELYSSLNKRYSDFEAFVKESNQASIYNYQLYLTEIEKWFGKKAIRLACFENITDNRVFLEEIENKLSVKFSARTIPQVNTKKASAYGVQIEGTSIKSILGEYLRKEGSWFTRAIFHFVRKAASALRLSHIGNKKMLFKKEIPYPDFDHFKSLFKESNDWLFKEHGIDY